MKVQFRRTYFGPDGNRYRPGIEHDVPEAWRKQLPSSATINDEAPKPKAKKVEEDDDSGPVEATASAAAGSAAKGTKL